MTATPTILQDIVRRETRSLLLYIGDSVPWTTVDRASDLATLRQLIHRETNAISAIGKYLVRQRLTPPFPGSYPANFTSYNFMDLSYLSPRLVAAQEQSISLLAADVARVQEPEAKKQLEQLLAVKQLTLVGLNALGSSQTRPASA